jgi:two-component system phosphate regulon sensor histidine kinase PhoR
MLIYGWILLACVGFAIAGALAWRIKRLNARVRELSALIPIVQETSEHEKQYALLMQEYEALLAYCGAGVLLLTSDDIIERANLTARYLLGVPTLNMIGKSLLQGTLSNDLAALVRAVRETRCVQRREVCAPGSSGCTLIVAASPVPGEAPEQCRVILVFHDVSELRRLETVRRDFVANVSHELRTPLTSIRAMAETLQDGALRDQTVADHFFNTIITETNRLTRISEDLLNLSKAESRSPEKQRFNLSALCEEVVSRVSAQAVKMNLRLTMQITPNLEVYANHDQIEQVLVNLLDNAIKYTPGGGEVALTAERTRDATIVSIKDTGIGIMSQDMPRIFERFYRVDKARSRQSGGTGLGLSIVKHIVESHGGTIRVESEYNRGSTFSFTLPNP